MKRQETPPTTLRQAVPFDTLSVRVYDEGRRLSPALGRSQIQYMLAAVLRHLYRASGRQLAHRGGRPGSRGASAGSTTLTTMARGFAHPPPRRGMDRVRGGRRGNDPRAGPQLLRVERQLREGRGREARTEARHPHRCSISGAEGADLSRLGPETLAERAL